MSIPSRLGLLLAPLFFAMGVENTAAAGPTPDVSGVSVILVHGAFADGSSWSKVIPLLRERGLNVVAVQNPLSSLKDDVSATERAINEAPGPVVLVGHSYGGVVITEAGNNPKVKALVYVAAFAPDSGQSIASMTKDAPPPAYAPFLRKDSGNFLTLTEDGIRTKFAQDLPSPEADLIYATQGPWAEGAISESVTHAAWHDKPVFTVIAEMDMMIPSAFQAIMANKSKAEVVHVPGSHVVMLSHPRDVTNLIVRAVSSVQ